MWYLSETVPDRPPAPRYWLGGVAKTQGISIGRKHVDIRLKASSVSRTHAHLYVEKAPFFMHPHPHRHSTVVAVSDSSAYGTFLKYPKGNPYSRDSNSHHVRLDKDKPSQIYDGALLSFGAPTAWWELVWKQILIVPYALSEPQRTRLATIAHNTGVDVSDTWVENATHLITDQCNVSNSKFLTALVSPATKIVKMHWIEAVNQVVSNTFRAIQEAPNNDAAHRATQLPNESQYVPAFDFRSVDTYGLELLETISDPDIVEQRKTFLQDLWFAFDTENHRLKWDNILKECAGQTTPANAKPEGIDDPSSPVELYYVSDKPQRARVPSNAHVISEAALICAILSAQAADLKLFVPKTPTDTSTKGSGKHRNQDANDAELAGLPTDNSSPHSSAQRKKPRAIGLADDQDDVNGRVSAMPPTKKMFRGMKGLAKRPGSSFAREDTETSRQAKRARLLNDVKRTQNAAGEVDEGEQSPFRPSVRVPESAEIHEDVPVSPVANLLADGEVHENGKHAEANNVHHDPKEEENGHGAAQSGDDIANNFVDRRQLCSGNRTSAEQTNDNVPAMPVEHVQLLPLRTPTRSNDGSGPDFRDFQPTRVITAPQIRLHPVVDRPADRARGEDAADQKN